jgi:hypothetical protein
MNATKIINRLEKLRCDNIEINNIINELQQNTIELSKMDIKIRALTNELEFDDVKNWYRITSTGLQKMQDKMSEFSRLYFKGKTGFDSEKNYVLDCFKKIIIKAN